MTAATELKEINVRIDSLLQTSKAQSALIVKLLDRIKTLENAS